MPGGRTSEATNRKVLLEFNTSKIEHCIFNEMQIIWVNYKWWQKTRLER